MNAERVNQIIDNYDADQTASLAILQDIQREYNFLPREAIELVSERLEAPVGHIYQMATFFTAFSLHPKGDHICKVCLGTACHVKGGALLLETLEREFNIKSGETTADGKLSVEGVRCLGACALAPIVVIDEAPHGPVSADQTVKLVKEAKAREKAPVQAPQAKLPLPVDLSSVPPAG